MRQWSLPTKLTLLVVPLSVVALLVGLLLVWNLVSTDDSVGFSDVDALAVAVAVVVGTVVLGSLIAAHRMGKSLSSRIGKVTASARRVARRDMIELLDALRAEDPDPGSIPPLDIDTRDPDEVGELARSLDELHVSLIDIGSRQMETLRRGVSKIFVTLARRNSSLVDRQLAFLDDLESREEDPKTLGGYYRLDHLATRMRRNAESLLVLAGAESPRVWAKASDMSDVVRAAISEVDEYQRIEIVALEPARLTGSAVSDVAHLVAELLENSIEFSPPSQPVRVTGLFDMDGYQLSVSDRGVGLSDARIAELNRILDKPPSLGLSLEPTLGMYVVARLAHRHGLDVELIHGVPGLTAKVTIPRQRLERTRESESRLMTGESPALADIARYADKATREYIQKRTSRDLEPEAEPAPAPAFAQETHEVVDLTRPEMLGENVRDEAPAGSRGSDPSHSLPVRTPGQAFRDPDPSSPSVEAGESGFGLRAALAAYERGRRAAGDTSRSGRHEDDDRGEDKP